MSGKVMTKVRTFIKLKHTGNVGQTAGVYLAAVLEYMYLSAEILELGKPY